MKHGAERRSSRGLARLAIALASVVALGQVGTTAATSASAATSTNSWQPEPATYGDTTVSNVSITMNDGVTLVGDVMYPTDLATGGRAHGDFPVLLTQNPYTCQTTEGNVGVAATLGPGTTGTSYFVQRGYILASICVRGTGRSGGTWEFFGTREQQDGVALVEWAAHRLDGSNGVIGLTGCSYLGATQLFTAGALHPGSPVKAILPACWGAETYREPSFAGGMPTQSLNYFRAAPAIIGPLQGPFGLSVANDIAAGGDKAYFRDWWQARNTGPYAKRIVENGIPALLWSGWNDLFAQGSMELYAQFQNAYAGRPVDSPMALGQKATGRYQIVVGPWAHATGIDQAIELRWFDTWLKGKPTGMVDTAEPMHLYQLGSATWINTNRYPMTTDYTAFYLRGGGSLTTTTPEDSAPDAIDYVQPSAPGGQLTYTSVPFKSGVTLAGPISARLYAASSGTNLNLITSLYDVGPDGTASKLSAGSIVGSLRQLDRSRSWFDNHGMNIRPYGRYAADDYLVPEQNYELTFRILPRVAQLAPGHAVRLTITTQTPATDCAGVLGTDPCYPTAPQSLTLPGTYEVQHSRAMPSAIDLPLLPYGCLPADGGNGAEPVGLGPSRPRPGVCGH
jgi:predicted acyl esterase